jgi:flagellar assembly protein FliH
MSGFIPKEKLTAYERWEMAAFDEGERAAQAAKSAQSNTTVTTETEPGLALPTAEEIERIHHEAHVAGYAAGHAEGYEAGCAAARAEAEQLQALCSNLEMQLQALDQQVAEGLLDVAVEIARQVLRQSLKLKPELLLPVVREAIAALPLHQGHPALFLHQEDAALVRQQLGEQLNHNGWRILEDGSLTRGGCRIESGASEVDATLEARWRRVLEAIGTNADWLDERS